MHSLLALAQAVQDLDPDPDGDAMTLSRTPYDRSVSQIDSLDLLGCV